MIKADLSILSFPSSGKHWLLYMLDVVLSLGLRYEIIGVTSFSISDLITISHSHLCCYGDIEPLVNSSGNIFLLRNYKENVIKFAERHDLGKLDSFKRYIDFKEPLRDTPVQSYMRLVNEFDKMDKPKIIVYYEDLIQSPKSEIIRILDWVRGYYNLQYSADDIDEFIFNIEYHKAAGRAFHLKNVGNPKDLLSMGEPIFHSKMLCAELKGSVDAYLEDTYPELFNKYLIRYKGL